MQRFVAIFSLLMALAATAFPAFAENRVALVIGENAYEHVQPLLKAVGDAKGYVAALREKGYAVTEGYDVKTFELNAKVAAFIDAIQPGDTAVFVYSGHGWSDGTRNYIIGIDAPATASQEYLARISIPIKNDANGILDDMDRKGANLKVAIVDACRDNPFAPPAGSKGFAFKRGFAPMGPPPSGTFVVFSAGFGQGALDRLSEADADPNGVFTRVFLPLLRADLTLQDAVKASQTKVVELSRSAGLEPQKPAYYDEVIGPACLSVSCKSAAPPPRVAAPAQTPPPAAPAPTTLAPPPHIGAAGAGGFATDIQARAGCAADIVVWVNTKSGVYHFAETHNYGTTKQGTYMCEADAKAAGDRAAKNEKHP